MTRAGFFQQLSALLKRNLLLKRRNKNQTFQEIFYPIFFVLILGLIRLLLAPEQMPGIPDIPAENLNQSSFEPFQGKTLLVYPDTQDTRTIIEDLIKSIPMDYIMFDNQTEMVETYRMNHTVIAGGIEFDSIDNSSASVSYSIREPYETLANSESIYVDNGECRGNDERKGSAFKPGCPAKTYLYSGFAVLQAVLDAAIIKFKSGANFTQPDLQVQMFPKLPFTPSIILIQTLSAIYFVVAYSPFVNFLVVNLVAEKESKIREMMKIVGLRDSVYWSSWSLVYLVIMMVVTGVCVLLAHFLQLFTNSNLFLLYLILLFYGLTIINLGFVLSPFFKKATTAGAVASLATAVFSLLYLPISLTRSVGADGLPTSTIPEAGQWALCLLSPTALALCIDQAIFLDIANKGMTFDTLTLGQFPLYAPLTMLFVDFLLYGLLAVYFDKVVPGEYGPRQPPWFFLMPSYWCPRKHSISPEDSSSAFGSSGNLVKREENSIAPPGDRRNIVEEVPPELVGKETLRLFGITKSFLKGEETVTAVKDMSLDIYNGQITCLLGHNGAGKTTLINMLTGLIDPSGGTATIAGYDVCNPNDMDEIRSMTGVCPQANCLFDDLTPREHLTVYAKIKGLAGSSVESEVEKSLRDVDMLDKGDSLAKTLSGGQKRKLSVAIALIGNPRVVFLDEPSAGMDPYSRRQLWTLLKAKRPGRVILLTTHFMDEADILADRKAFIKSGRLQCCGSSLFLKNKFGIGYHLGMVIDPNAEVSMITSVVKGCVPNAQETRKHGQEVSYTLPIEDVSLFPELFAKLETDSDTGEKTSQSLGIHSYGVSMTTLEEVFLRLEGADDDNDEDDVIAAGDSVDSGSSLQEEGTSKRSYSGPRASSDQAGLYIEEPPPCSENLSWRRFKAVCKIRALQTLRNKMGMIFRVFFPVVLIFIGVIVNKNVGIGKPDFANPKPRLMTPIFYAKMSVGPDLGLPNMIYEIDTVVPGNVTKFVQGLQYQGLSPEMVNASANLSLIAPHNLGIKIHHVDPGTGPSNFTAVYNDTAVHSLPVALNIITNALYQMVMSNPLAHINATSLPWPVVSPGYQLNNGVFSSVIMIGVALSTLPSGFASDIVKDRQDKARSQLRISGITWSMYWGTMFFTSVMLYYLSAVLAIIVLLAFQVESIMYAGAVVCVLILFLFYIPLMTLISFNLSFMFAKSETALTVVPNILLFTSFLPYIAVATIESTNESTGKLLHTIFSIVDPPYAVYGGLYYVDKVYRLASLVEDQPVIPFGDYFKWDNNVLITLIMPPIHLIWVFLLLLVLDVRSTGGKISDILPFKQPDTQQLDNNDIPGDEDSDVTEERRRVKSLDQDGENAPVVVVKNLRKEFEKSVKGNKCFGRDQNIHVAVRNTSFAVGPGEVFGLLGPNGAGKTTTLNMIIAEEGVTRGNVTVVGNDVHSSMSSAFQDLGYCPQHDPIWPEITLAEHIECYAAIRGVHPQLIKSLKERYISALEIEEHKNKRARQLSGGTKRKLSYIMSLLGDPKVVLLDEPSTGMDPKSKRFLWDTINSTFQGSPRGAILTTHYMEEADALCSRVSIMVNGQMKCIGSTQHLKLKYSSGYVLEIKLGEKDAVRLEQMKKSLTEFVVGNFPHASVAETFGDRATYKIPDDDMKSLAQAFTVLEEQGKQLVGIEDYTLSHSTLEQVFLEFARHQLEEGQSSEDDPQPDLASVISV
ncbi:cholesterol transporter ABCA5-like isoform X2 [Lineus longissimus]|uniref:cholesterol transporter ABCA5-like isoform X2 n=1 Tax=Lineus longissimus TaxID=88925 RepID=UPI00315CCDC9